MSLERDLKLAQAESRIEQAERNIRQVKSLFLSSTRKAFLLPRSRVTSI